MSQAKPPARRKAGGSPRRTHGYRGYGSGFGRGTSQYGGAVHWGAGFGGIGVPASGGISFPAGGFFTPEISERGPYAGVGPKGYSRSDDRIREDICDELTRRSDIDPRHMTVAVKNGEVTIGGTVVDILARSLAEEIAARCAGVTGVRNLLRVESSRSGSRPS